MCDAIDMIEKRVFLETISRLIIKGFLTPDQGFELCIEEGERMGVERIIRNMLNSGKSPKEIHAFCGIPLDTVNKVQATMADNLLVSRQNDENETLHVIEDARKGVGVSKAYTNIDDLMRDLNAGD